MWAADRVVAPTPGSAITIPKTANEFAINGNHLTPIKGNQFDGRPKNDPHKHIHKFLEICDMFKYRDTENEVVRLMMFPLSLTREAKTWLDELNEGTIETKCSESAMVTTCPKATLSKSFTMLLEDKVLLKLDWAKNQKTKSSLKKTVDFTAEDNSNSDTDEIMARMDAMTMKMDAQLADKQSGRPSGSLPSNTQPNPKGSSSKPYQPPQARKEHVNAVFTRSGKSYDPLHNLDDQQNNSETPINFDSDDEDDEPIP
ncbi:hypothetical protein Tco_0489549 [Tanacetum coccineum]